VANAGGLDRSPRFLPSSVLSEPFPHLSVGRKEAHKRLYCTVRNSYDRSDDHSHDDGIDYSLGISTSLGTLSDYKMKKISRFFWSPDLRDERIAIVKHLLDGTPIL
jgi:hypothetical protein